MKTSNKISITELVLHPIRMRVIQEMAIRPTVTTAELGEALPDVPRTTLYRHVSTLVDHGIARVVSERRVRGSVERTLALDGAELGRHNTREGAAGNALAFLLNRYARFHAYLERSDADTGRDRLFLNGTVMMMDDGEFDRFLLRLRELLVEFSLGPGEGRRPRDISIISSPTDETGK